MENENGKQIFLSYSSNSKEQTSKLAERLKRMGHEVWFDQALSGGQIWWDEICVNIRDCDLFIFVLDKNSQLSDACEVEWRYAIELGREILPVKIANDVAEKILPTALAKCQIFDYSNPNIESSLDLAKQIKEIPLPGDLPTPLPPQPPAPMSYLHALAEKVWTFDRLSESEQKELVQSLEKMIRDGIDDTEATILLEKLKRNRSLERGKNGLEVPKEPTDRLSLFSGFVENPESYSNKKQVSNVEELRRLLHGNKYSSQALGLLKKLQNREKLCSAAQECVNEILNEMENGSEGKLIETLAPPVTESKVVGPNQDFDGTEEDAFEYEQVSDQVSSSDEPLRKGLGQEEPDPGFVFVSYSALDQEIADAIHDQLITRNIACWTPCEDDAASEEEFYPNSLEFYSKAFEDCKFILAIVGKNARNCSKVIREILSARQLEKRVVLIVTEDDEEWLSIRKAHLDDCPAIEAFSWRSSLDDIGDFIQEHWQEETDAATALASSAVSTVDIVADRTEMLALDLAANLGRQQDSGLLANPNPVSTASDEIHEEHQLPQRDINPQLINQILGGFTNSRVFVAPNIPSKKLKNAVTTYGCGVRQSSVLLLYDDTLFGGARNGLMITKDSVCWKNKSGNATRVLYSDIENVKGGIFLNAEIAGVMVNEEMAVTNSCDNNERVANNIARLIGCLLPPQIEFHSDSFGSYPELDVTLYGHLGVGTVNSVEFSPEGTRIASGSDDNTIKIWDAASGQEINTLEGHADSVASIAFSPEGARIVSGSYDNTIKIWDAASGQEINTLVGHTDSVTSVAFSPDGARIASGSEDATTKLWDAVSGLEINTLKGNSAIYGVTFNPDGARIASGCYDNTIKIWDAVSGEEINTLKGHAHRIMCVAYSPDGVRMASGSMEGTIKLWDAVNGMEIDMLKGHTHWVANVAFSPDGSWIASGSMNDATIKLWNAASGQELATLKVNTSVTSVAFSPDGTRIASGTGHNTIKIWRFCQRSGLR